MNIFDPSTWSPEVKEAALDITKVLFVLVVALVSKGSGSTKAIRD